jgi:hypothetical protein
MSDNRQLTTHHGQRTTDEWRMANSECGRGKAGGWEAAKLGSWDAELIRGGMYKPVNPQLTTDHRLQTTDGKQLTTSN